MKIVSNKRVTSRSPTPPPPQLLSCKTNTVLSSPKNVKIECFHSRGQRLCKLFGTKESVCIRKEFNFHRTGRAEEVGRGLVLKMFWILNQPWFTQNVVVMDLVISLTQNLFLDPPLPQANSCLFLVRWWYKC